MSNRIKRQLRVRAKISGNAVRPRINVFRSGNHIFIQAIDDAKGITLASASDFKTEKLEEVVTAMAKDLQSKKIRKVIFDRGGYKYHGKVKQVAELLRKQGLEF